MQVMALPLCGLKLITPKIARDARGYVSETFNAGALAAAGITARFVQDNHSLSLRKGVVRGLHFQVPPRAQAKLVRVTRGAVLDVAVDIRTGSPTYGRHVAVVLSAENRQQVWIPEGFAHGLCTLEPETEVHYKLTDYYAPECERGLKWDDPALAIEWPMAPHEAIVSAKDARHPPLASLESGFVFQPQAGEMPAGL